MQLIVSNKIYNIEPWRSGFHLKCLINKYNPEQITLSCNGKPIIDNMCLDQQGINNGSAIFVHNKGRGGFSKWTVLFWLAIIVYTGTLFLLMATGVFNMVAYLYGFFIKWGIHFGLEKILGLFGQSDIAKCLKVPIRWIVAGINFLIKHSIVFVFVYTALTALSYPILGIRFKDHCQALYLAKKVGVICAILYIFIYGLLNVPNLLYNAAMTFFSLFGTTRTIINPALQAQKDAVDDAKYLGFYAIPFVGQGIEQLHFIISQIVNSIYAGSETFKGMTCKNYAPVTKALRQINSCLKRDATLSVCEAYSGLIQAIRNNRMQDLLKFAYMGLTPNIYQRIKEQYEKAGFLTKIDILGITTTGNNYFGSTAARWIVCAILSAINETDDYFAYIGRNADAIIDTIKMGNISGMITTAGYVIVMVITLIYPAFLGYL